MLDTKISKERKICLVIPTLHDGGMERVMSELASFFSTKANIEVHLVLYGKNPEIFYPLSHKIIIYKPPNKLSYGFKIISAINRAFYLRKTVRKINPDSILSFGEIWNTFVLIVLFGYKYPVFVSDRCSPEKEFSIYQTLLRKLLYPTASGIIVQTSKALEIYSSSLKVNNIVKIPNPIRRIERKNQIKRQNYILTVGRLIKSKNHDLLIKIFADSNCNDWKLVIVGDDALRQKNKEALSVLINDLKMEDRIKLVGRISDVDNYYLNSKIFAFTSSSEGFPNVIGEAMSAGLPVLSFDCIAGPSEMITNNATGFLIPLFDLDAFKAKLNLLIRSSELREQFGYAGKEKVKELSIDRIGTQYLDFILNAKL